MEQGSLGSCLIYGSVATGKMRQSEGAESLSARRENPPAFIQFIVSCPERRKYIISLYFFVVLLQQQVDFLRFKIRASFRKISMNQKLALRLGALPIRTGIGRFCNVL